MLTWQRRSTSTTLATRKEAKDHLKNAKHHLKEANYQHESSKKYGGMNPPTKSVSHHFVEKNLDKLPYKLVGGKHVSKSLTKAMIEEKGNHMDIEAIFKGGNVDENEVMIEVDIGAEGGEVRLLPVSGDSQEHGCSPQRQEAQGDDDRCVQQRPYRDRWQG